MARALRESAIGRDPKHSEVAATAMLIMEWCSSFAQSLAFQYSTRVALQRLQ